MTRLRRIARLPRGLSLGLALTLLAACGGDGAAGSRAAATGPAASLLPAPTPNCLVHASAGLVVTPAQLFDDPPKYPGYQWEFKGCAAPPEMITSYAGPDHCRWESATYLSISWPPGTPVQAEGPRRLYVRDPRGVLQGPGFHAPQDLRVSLPPEAGPTGFEYRGVQIYASPADADAAVYVVGDVVTEKWPRDVPFIGCV